MTRTTPLSIPGVAISLTALLLFDASLLPGVRAQDSSPGGPVHEGQPDNCSGWHTVVEGDDCQSVPAQYGITFEQFLEWNPAVSEDCLQNFWLESAYCVRAPDSSPGGPVHEGQPENCNGWHTVVEGDDCQSVPALYGISFQQFLEWNPAVSQDCIQNFWLESAYCVSIGSPPSESSQASSSPPETSQSAPTSSVESGISSSTSQNTTYSTRHPVTDWNITTTTVDYSWPPTKTLEGQPDRCNRWHRVVPGDTCQTVLNRYGLLTRSEFLDWNPGVEADCDELLADYWVCIGVQNVNPNTDLEWETPQPEFTPPPDPTEHTPTTFPSVDPSFTPEPSHGPMPEDCQVYHLVEADQNCNDIVNIYGYLSQQQFFDWNPVLDGNCHGLWLDTWYCVGAFDGAGNLPLPSHITTTSESGPRPTGHPNDCTRWYFTTGDESCDDIAAMFGSFDAADFIAWNPSVFSDCAGITSEAWYCVGRPGTPTTRTEGAPTPTDGDPDARPTQSGVAEDCTDFWLVESSDETCASIARKAGVSVDDLYVWNHMLTFPECGGLVPDYYICVGVDDSAEASASASASGDGS